MPRRAKRAAGARSKRPPTGEGLTRLLVPASAVALNERGGGGRAPGAGEIVTRLQMRLVPRLADGIDPGPGRLHLVAAHEQRGVAAYDVRQQTLIGFRRIDLKRLGEI